MGSTYKEADVEYCPDTSWHRPPQFKGQQHFKPRYPVTKEHFTIKEYEPDMVNNKYPPQLILKEQNKVKACEQMEDSLMEIHNSKHKYMLPSLYDKDRRVFKQMESRFVPEMDEQVTHYFTTDPHDSSQLTTEVPLTTSQHTYKHIDSMNKQDYISNKLQHRVNKSNDCIAFKDGSSKGHQETENEYDFSDKSISFTFHDLSWWVDNTRRHHFLLDKDKEYNNHDISTYDQDLGHDSNINTETKNYPSVNSQALNTSTAPGGVFKSQILKDFYRSNEGVNKSKDYLKDVTYHKNMPIPDQYKTSNDKTLSWRYLKKNNNNNRRVHKESVGMQIASKDLGDWKSINKLYSMNPDIYLDHTRKSLAMCEENNFELSDDTKLYTNQRILSHTAESFRNPSNNSVTSSKHSRKTADFHEQSLIRNSPIDDGINSMNVVSWSNNDGSSTHNGLTMYGTNYKDFSAGKLVSFKNIPNQVSERIASGRKLTFEENVKPLGDRRTLHLTEQQRNYRFLDDTFELTRTKEIKQPNLTQEFIKHNDNIAK